MSGEEELRRRLQELPGPASRLDVDAVVERARKRRRPKVAAVTAAATGAGVLIVAPFVVPGLSPMSPSSTVMSDQGAAQEAAPEQDSSGGDASGATEADGSVALACAYPAIRAETGIEATFTDDPADGIAGVELLLPDEAGTLEVLGVGIAQVAVDDPLTIVAAQDLSVLEAAANAGSTTPGSEAGSVTLADVVLPDGPLLGCGIDAATAPAPLLLIELEGRRLAVVGDAYPVR
ncbi:hypothetical protein L332_04170 [Agrococcus pavilionensis RW1]|uniref:Uncharacterized protein n=1 Tax=Agrococcus pavilionensis RW1 TaxID=1330458 RepID=U1MSM0_9MICO|nr:hypothetical protein [Agrococcus pavilionensis]ERG63650.1 hypothetical protein L332_04170 [Agrococcus pavilionensis RW1]